MKSKSQIILILIGVILGLLFSILGIGNYFWFKSMNQELKNEFISLIGINLELMVLWSLISSIIGLVLSIIIIFYIIRIIRNPTKIDFIVITVLGCLGLFFSMSVGGILVLIGGIIGIVKSNKSGIA
ncbi:hypothetical protein GOV12_07790 [Candidatus Pacearchaeota archaeon]|nr:hypothetical protein [Candidatus Pacearchaeota archaeon]